MHGSFIETIKHFRDTDVKFGGFHRHWWRRGKAEEEQWWWWQWREREKRGSDNGSRGWWSGDPGNREGGREVVGKYTGFVFFLDS